MLIVEDLRRGIDQLHIARDTFREAAVNDDDVTVVAEAAAIRDELNGLIVRARALFGELS